jgi:cysteine desulfurase
MQRVCFDHFSGTPMEPAVLEAMQPWFSEHFGGTGAVHSGGVEARAAIDEAREKVARFINAASPEEIIFTSSGTEAINLAIKGCAFADRKRGNDVVFSAIEHPAVTQSIEWLETQGFNGICGSADREGRIIAGEIASFKQDHVILVCAHASNHDIGTIQDLRRIGDAAEELGAGFFVDATYAAGWMPIDVQGINAGYLAMAPHRFGGPKGVGILFKQRRARLAPMIHGGAQELGWRAGTENISGIIGAGVACELAMKEMAARVDHVGKLQARMWEGISARVKNVRLNGPVPGAKRLPNSLNFSVAGVEGEGLALSLDMKGFAITSGQACATKANKVPATLAAIHVPEDYAVGTVILSFGKENTVEEVDRFLEVFPGVVEKLRALG